MPSFYHDPCPLFGPPVMNHTFLILSDLLAYSMPFRSMSWLYPLDPLVLPLSYHPSDQGLKGFRSEAPCANLMPFQSSPWSAPCQFHNLWIKSLKYWKDLRHTVPIWCPLDQLLDTTFMIPPLVLLSSYHSLASSFSPHHWLNELQIRCLDGPKHTLINWCCSDPVLEAHLANLKTFGASTQRYLSNPSTGPPIIFPFFGIICTPCHLSEGTQKIKPVQCGTLPQGHQPHPLAWRLLGWCGLASSNVWMPFFSKFVSLSPFIHTHQPHSINFNLCWVLHSNPPAYMLWKVSLVCISNDLSPLVFSLVAIS